MYTYEPFYFFSEFAKVELGQIKKKALDFMNRKPMKSRKCESLYRNKVPIYWRDIEEKRNNIMEAYVKDYTGDPASAINGKVNGLFFGVSVEKRTGEMPTMSFFGSKRLVLPVLYLLEPSEGSARMYFSDFYCINRAHYVTLVLTKTGSSVDDFCQKKLLQISMYDNPFLYIDNTQSKDNPTVFVTSNVWVEVFYTEDVDINKALENEAYFSRIRAFGKSKLYGSPKKSTCAVCNLYKAAHRGGGFLRPKQEPQEQQPRVYRRRGPKT